MIDYIEKLCNIWGDYYAGGDRVDTWFPSESPIYRMMRELAPTHLGNYRQSRHYLPMESTGAPRLILRNISPMRAKETHSRTPQQEPQNPLADMVEAGIGFLNNARYKEVAELKYLRSMDNTTAAKTIDVSINTYKKYVDCLHVGLDVYIRTNHPEMFRQIQALG